MKLSYWKCKCLDDSDCYSIRTKTKKDAIAQREGREDSFSVPYKVEVEYSDTFSLLTQALGEGKIYEDDNEIV